MVADGALRARCTQCEPTAAGWYSLSRWNTDLLYGTELLAAICDKRKRTRISDTYFPIYSHRGLARDACRQRRWHGHPRRERMPMATGAATTGNAASPLGC